MPLLNTYSNNIGTQRKAWNVQGVVILLVYLLAFPLWLSANAITSGMAQTRLLIVVDCSESMGSRWQSDSRLKVAQRALLRVADSIANYNNLTVGLRTLALNQDGTLASSLELPFTTGEKATKGKPQRQKTTGNNLQSKLKALIPVASANQTTTRWNDFAACGNCRNIVLVVADESTLQSKAAGNALSELHTAADVVRTFVVSIGSGAKHSRGSDSTIVWQPVADEDALYPTLHGILTTATQQARVAVALLGDDGKSYATDMPMAFYDHRSHALRLSTIYHYSQTDTPDTLTLDPLISYDITLFTHPEIQLTNRHFAPDRCSRLDIHVAQGSLRLQHETRRTPFDIPTYNIIIRQHGGNNIAAIQPVGTTTYCQAGRYDIEVLSLPPLHLDNIEIRPGNNTDLQIPLPGQFSLTKPKVPTTGVIFALRVGMADWVCDLDPATADERIVLMPGQYQVVLRRNDNGKVTTASFTIKPAQQTALTLE